LEVLCLVLIVYLHCLTLERTHFSVNVTSLLFLYIKCYYGSKFTRNNFYVCFHFSHILCIMQIFKWRLELCILKLLNRSHKIIANFWPTIILWMWLELHIDRVEVALIVISTIFTYQFLFSISSIIFQRAPLFTPDQLVVWWFLSNSFLFSCFVSYWRNFFIHLLVIWVQIIIKEHNHSIITIISLLLYNLGT